MAKKQNQKDPSGFVFDVQSKAVIAQGGTYENMKEKINAVRAVVPNRSNNEIILVLQHFDNSVDKAVQSFMEGSANEVLKEWTVTGKKKNKKKKSKPKPQVEVTSTAADPSIPVSNDGEQLAASSEKDEMNGYHVNGSMNDTESVDSLSEQFDSVSVDARELEDSEPATSDIPVEEFEIEEEELEPEPEAKPQTSRSSQKSQQNRSHQQHRNANRHQSRPTAISQSAVSLSLTMPEDAASGSNKKAGSSIEKSVKDLQRCTVSLARYRAVVKDQMDASIRKMKQNFAELQTSLMDREVALLGEMDKVKAEANEILGSRQKKAEELKRLTDLAVRMSEEQLSELRADIKHFVSERKYDEDLGRVARFTCDLETLKNSIQTFGQVSHPKNSYSTRSRCSSVSSVSLTSPSDVSAPTTPDCASNPSLTTLNKKAFASGDSQLNTAAATSASMRPSQPQKQVFQGNRRPGQGQGQGQGYRQQGPRPNGSFNTGRYDDRNRYRNGPRNTQSGYRYQNSQPRAPENTNERNPSHSLAANGTDESPEPNWTTPSNQAASTASSMQTNGLPQRHPKSNRPEVSAADANS